MPGLAFEITRRNGTKLRFGPDEADIGRVPTAIGFGTELPGGYGPADVTLPRPDRFDPLEIELWNSGRIYEADTNETRYVGRVVGHPVAEGTISLALEGFSKALEDDKTATFLGIDTDLSRWTPPSTARQIVLDGAPYSSFNLQEVVADTTTGAPALQLSLEGAWSHTGTCEAWYDAGASNSVGYLDYAWKTGGGLMSFGDLNWIGVFGGATDDLGTGAAGTGDIATGSSAAAMFTVGGKRFLYAQLVYNAAGGLAGDKYTWHITWLGVIGNHGITPQGTLAAPNTGRGLLVSGCLGYLVSRFAPSLSYSTGTGGSIETTTFAMPHIVFLDATTCLEMVEAMVLMGGSSTYPLDWGVYHDANNEPEFFAKTPGTYGKKWKMRLDLGGSESWSGPDASRRINGVQISYDDGSGTTLSYGPLGSGADDESELLQDTDPDNPANQRNERHWESLSVGITSTAGALLIGQLVLAERNRQDWRGDVTVRGMVEDDAGNEFPVAAIRAGDSVVAADSDDTTERRIVGTTYNQDDDSNQVSIGQKPDRFDTLLANLGAVTEGRIV